MVISETTIISLGGSLIVPDEVDVKFLRDFTSLIKEEVSRGARFVLITGGGKVCRRYQAAAKELGVTSQEDIDWVGIHATRLNGHFLRLVLGNEITHHEVITDPSDLSGIKKSVVIAAGWKPGWSTDFDAVEMAKESGAKNLINLSNIDYVYDKDPKQFSDAKKIESISWAEFIKIIPEGWQPGLNSPFDPIAARNAAALKLEIAILNGKDMSNLRNYLKGRGFVGTVIK